MAVSCTQNVPKCISRAAFVALKYNQGPNGEVIPTRSSAGRVLVTGETVNWDVVSAWAVPHAQAHWVGAK